MTPASNLPGQSDDSRSTLATPDVTLSIVSFSTRDLLRACLDSVAALVDAARVEVIVVDNASTDGSPEMVASEYPWVKLIRNDTNRYFAPAHNQAFAVARGRYVGILNSDTRLVPDTLQKMVAFMDARPQAGACTCTYLRDDGSQLKPEAHNYWRFHSLMYAVLCRNNAGERLYHMLGGGRSVPIATEAEAIETDVVSDTFLLVRRDVLELIGGYDEGFLLYFTEDDICASVKRAGYRVYYYSGARLVHSLSASVRRSSPYWIRWIFATDGMRYFRKHGDLPSRVLAVPVLFGAYLVDALVITKRMGRWK
jgi:N-acetylglucosaminyl-diphospho-decaprenol L-rhamnosyltransferase